MAKKKSSSLSPLVYSTDPLFVRDENTEEVVTLPAAQQKLRVCIDKKQRAGKVVTLVTGFAGKEEDLQELSRELKSFCGTGGSVKDGIIMIQGDNKEKIVERLFNKGYAQVKKM